MRNASRFALVMVTAPSLEAARHLASCALQKRLVACANLVPGLESHYWWKGKQETAAEVLILFKARMTDLAALEKALLSNHPYETPEVVAVPFKSGTSRYLAWLADSTRRDASRALRRGAA